jgi:hypothetical protein
MSPIRLMFAALLIVGLPPRHAQPWSDQNHRIIAPGFGPIVPLLLRHRYNPRSRGRLVLRRMCG